MYLNDYQSHHTGIEINTIKAFVLLFGSTNRTTLELKFVSPMR